MLGAGCSTLDAQVLWVFSGPDLDWAGVVGRLAMTEAVSTGGGGGGRGAGRGCGPHGQWVRLGAGRRRRRRQQGGRAAGQQDRVGLGEQVSWAAQQASKLLNSTTRREGERASRTGLAQGQAFPACLEHQTRLHGPPMARLGHSDPIWTLSTPSTPPSAAAKQRPPAPSPLAALVRPGAPLSREAAAAAQACTSASR
ncbi:hypothetical protein BS50DRAFT_354877 [Corynespora cassiicola Philippines]|uniref:Uncharacterized protein n=1 Tax=Corynespora cassiicola Philippines TaxID=1448308 RepID=A0A2T2NSF0_CORCC|nr:hypothetical protein BS50DRAFT_354877 [Corynespora cassiicola Philippines]